MLTLAKLRAWATAFRLKWIHNPANCPVDWRPGKHPHAAYGLLSRLLISFTGSIVPVGTLLIATEFIAQIPELKEEPGMAYEATMIVLIVGWGLSLWPVVISEQKKLHQYAFLGTGTPV